MSARGGFWIRFFEPPGQARPTGINIVTDDEPRPVAWGSTGNFFILVPIQVLFHKYAYHSPFCLRKQASNPWLPSVSSPQGFQQKPQDRAGKPPYWDGHRGRSFHLLLISEGPSSVFQCPQRAWRHPQRANYPAQHRRDIPLRHHLAKGNIAKHLWFATQHRSGQCHRCTGVDATISGCDQCLCKCKYWCAFFL